MKLLLCCLAFCVCFVLCDSANAQQLRRGAPYRYVPPGGPTMPSGLNYFRQDTGLLDPYNAFVAPQRNLNQQLGTLYDQQQLDASNIRRLQNPREVNVAPTGTGAVFMNYSHYYRIQPPAARAR
jgi:hypothetical protein